MIKRLAEKTAAYVVKNDDTADLETLAYGFDILYQELSVILISFVISIPFGVPFHVLATNLVFKALRTYAGGPHANRRIVCTVSTVLAMFGPALLFGRLGITLRPLTIMLLSVFSFVMISIYAPADTETRPVRSPGKRRKMKLAALMLVVVFTAAALLLNDKAPSYAAILAVIPAVIGCNTHPAMYWMFGCEKSKQVMEVAE